MNFLALVLACVLKGEARHASGSLLRNNLQALDHPRNNFVFDAGVQSLGIFAHHDEIDSRIARRNMRKVPDWPEISEQFEALAKFHVDAGKPAANRRCHRPL